MTTIKSYTDLEQSKKLAEILQLDSADYFHAPDAGMVVTEPYMLNEGDETIITAYKGAVPCWSLSALLEILSKIASKTDDDGSADLSSFMGKWYINMFECPVEAIGNYDNAVDACYEMILKLYELKML